MLALRAPTSYADVIRNTPGLVGYWRMAEKTGAVLKDELNLHNGTYVATPGLGQGTPIADGSGVKFNGTTQTASVAIDLSAYAQASVSFWLANTWPAANHVAVEYGTPEVDHNPAGAGFLMSPGSATVTVGIAKTTASPQYWLDTFTIPTASVWHHFVLTFDRATPVNTVYIDGAPKTLTTSTHTATVYGNFANGSLYLMSRGTTTFFRVGTMAEVALFAGRILTVNDAATQYNAGIGR